MRCMTSSVDSSQHGSKSKLSLKAAAENRLFLSSAAIFQSSTAENVLKRQIRRKIGRADVIQMAARGRGGRDRQGRRWHNVGPASETLALYCASGGVDTRRGRPGHCALLMWPILSKTSSGQDEPSWQ